MYIRLLVLVLAITLSACGGSASSNDNNPIEKDTDTITVNTDTTTIETDTTTVNTNTTTVETDTMTVNTDTTTVETETTTVTIPANLAIIHPINATSYYGLNALGDYYEFDLDKVGLDSVAVYINSEEVSDYLKSSSDSMGKIRTELVEHHLLDGLENQLLIQAGDASVTSTFFWDGQSDNVVLDDCTDKHCELDFNGLDISRAKVKSFHYSNSATTVKEQGFVDLELDMETEINLDQGIDLVTLFDLETAVFELETYDAFDNMRRNAYFFYQGQLYDLGQFIALNDVLIKAIDYITSLDPSGNVPIDIYEKYVFKLLQNKHVNSNMDIFSNYFDDYLNVEDGLSLYYRLYDSSYIATEEELAEAENTDELVSKALYCDIYSLPGDYLEQLHQYLDHGGYSATHAQLSLIFLKWNGCTVNGLVFDEFRLDLKEELFAIFNHDLSDLDIEIVAFGFELFGNDYILPYQSLINTFIRDQRENGSWLEDNHSTVLAMWLVLAYQQDILNLLP